MASLEKRGKRFRVVFRLGGESRHDESRELRPAGKSLAVFDSK
jgi:hypothetical protein